MRLKLVLDDIGAFSKNYREIASSLCHKGSDFHRKLQRFMSGDEPTTDDGYLSVVKIDGEIVGWARSERWEDGNHMAWDTLEAFVHPHFRSRGIAAIAAASLVAGPLYGTGSVAVFHPHMLLVAKKAGIFAQLFEQRKVTRWERVS